MSRLLISIVVVQPQGWAQESGGGVNRGMTDDPWFREANYMAQRHDRGGVKRIDESSE